MAAGITGIPAEPAMAHGKPEHGGAFCEVKEYTFETVALRKGDSTEFTVYVKDPALKPVKSCSLTMNVWLSGKESQPVTLTADGAGSYKGSANLPARGRYKVSLLFALPGQQPLKCGVSVKVS